MIAHYSTTDSVADIPSVIRVLVGCASNSKTEIGCVFSLSFVVNALRVGPGL